jgi:hypothetical protein
MATEQETNPVEPSEVLTPEEQAIDTRADDMLKTEQAIANAGPRLESVFGNESTPEETPAAEATPTPEPAAEVSTPAPVETPAEKPAEVPADVSAPVETPADESTKITDAEIRAAKHYEYSDEDIKKLTDIDPVLAKKTFAKMLRDENNLSKKFSEAGKKLVTPPPVAPPVPAIKPELKKVDIETLRKEYEGDPIVGVIEAMQANNEAMAAQLAARPVAESFTESEATRQTQVAREQENAAISQQIDGFFLRPDVKALKQFYGDTSIDSEGQPIPKENRSWDNSLTPNQLKNRWKVMQEANLIKLGMEAQGLKPNLEEVFDRAHLLVTADVREQVIRTKIKAEATKRQAGLTLAPSSSKAVPSTSVKTKEQILANAHKNLASVFG